MCCLRVDEISCGVNGRAMLVRQGRRRAARACAGRAKCVPELPALEARKDGGTTLMSWGGADTEGHQRCAGSRRQHFRPEGR